jgi:hypothetical protein
MRTIVPALMSVCLMAAEPAPEIPVTTVVLYSSGVGYFEHQGSVEGMAQTQLRFKTGQINDVLKSLVLQDLDGGSIGTVVYPSQDPLDKTLASFQVDLRGNPPLAQVLSQLRGAAVQVGWQSEKIAGTILGVETRTRVLGDKQTVTISVLNLLTASGLRQLPLDEVSALALSDPKLQSELTSALAVVAQARDQDSKPVELHFDGQGKRGVRIGYVVETPLWKVSYRLVMPEVGKDQAGLQGWAMVDNQTDSDWKGIKLSLVSGRPLSFIQDLYRPRYLPRPVVEADDEIALKPQAYGGAMPVMAAGVPMAVSGERSERAKGRALSAREDVAMDEGRANFARPLDIAASVRSRAQGEEVGALFQYQVSDVTLPRQRSAMLPIVTAAVQVERLSIFNPAVHAKHPLAGALVTNTTANHLLAGPVSVFDGGAYAGDAQLTQLPPGEHRLLSFALDLPVTVDPKVQREESRIVSGRIVDGVLWMNQAQVAIQEYSFSDSSPQPRTVLVEYPRRSGWTLQDTPAPFESTDSVHRFKVAVPAGGKPVSFTVRETHVEQQSMVILDIDDATLLGYAQTAAIAPKVRAALQQAAQLKAQVVEAERTRAAKQAEVQAIVQDQQRLRENMRTVQGNQTSPYYQRLLAKLNDQESKVEALQIEVDRLQTEAEGKRKALSEYLNKLAIE